MQRTSGLRAAVDPATEEGRSFLQERIGLFGKWFFLAALAFYVLANLPIDLLLGRPFDPVDEWLGPEERLTLAVVAVAGMMWLFASGPPRSTRKLKVVEAASVILACSLLGAVLLQLVLQEGQVHEVYLVLLASTNVVTVRAIVVPSTARRTLAVSIGALATPVALIAVTTLASSLVPQVTATYVSVGGLLWAAIGVASATATSRMLFQLRVEASKVQRLGQYTLEQKIGEGGMGVVYRASHAMLRRPTAIKLLAPDKNRDVDLRRFEREVQRTAQLTHPNTVAIYDYGRTPAGVFYYAMELLDGITLQELVDQDGAQEPARVIHILRQVCGALHEAHAAGLVHRDVKPSNLMLCDRGGTPDVVKVLDFGLVKVQGPGDDVGLSHADAVIGTPLYIAPETLSDPRQISSSVDIYALGAVGYFLLTGSPVFDGKNVAMLCSQHLTAAPLSPSQRLGRPVPEDLEAVIMSCLAKRPVDRPDSAGALAEALAGCADAPRWSWDRAHLWWRELRRRSQTTGMRAVTVSHGTMDVDLAHRAPAGTPTPAGQSASPPSG